MYLDIRVFPRCVTLDTVFQIWQNGKRARDDALLLALPGNATRDDPKPVLHDVRERARGVALGRAVRRVEIELLSRDELRVFLLGAGWLTARPFPL